MDWKQRALIFEDLPWSRLDTNREALSEKNTSRNKKELNARTSNLIFVLHGVPMF